MKPENPPDSSAAEVQPAAAALEHLTGPSRGTITWLAHPELELTLGARRIHASTGPAGPGEERVARLRRDEDGYVIEALDGQPLWVNGRRVESRRLKHHDVIEFREDGPISRYFLYDDSHKVRLTLSDIVSDTVAYLRNSRQPIGTRILRSLDQVLRRLARETTVLFRLGVVIALLVLAGFAYQQSRINVLLRQQIEAGSAQLEDISRALVRARDEALTPNDLQALSEELSSRMVTTAERVSELERRSTAIGRVIAESQSSIIFLQGAYQFRDKDSGRLLRHMVGDDGKPLILPSGLPLLTLEGEGPVATRQFMGTGFVVGDDGVIVTNRHVAMPWEHDSGVTTLAERGLEPEVTKFVGYVPGNEAPQTVELVKVSDEADVAILKHAFTPGQAKGLRLAEGPPEPGDEVIVMGYPTGLKSILAQAGKAFIEELQASEDIDFWSVAERLSRSGRIVPLASRGIVGRVSAETIVYDAETTHGGSGGPVLDTLGEVVAVNAAILPEYGGSNLGVPVELLRPLLADASSF